MGLATSHVTFPRERMAGQPQKQEGVPKEQKGLPFVWCSVSKGKDFCHNSKQENTESPEEIRHEAVLL